MTVIPRERVLVLPHCPSPQLEQSRDQLIAVLVLKRDMSLKQAVDFVSNLTGALDQQMPAVLEAIRAKRDTPS
jgi:hypothetical protein